MYGNGDCRLPTGVGALRQSMELRLRMIVVVDFYSVLCVGRDGCSGDCCVDHKNDDDDDDGGPTSKM